MKNVFLGLILAFVAVPAFAGNCGSCAKTVTTQVVTTATRVVTAPVRVVGGLRGRAAARRACSLETRATRAEALAVACSREAVCSSCNEESEPAKT